jgi:nucleotide-binding universal stress UspA family protein
MTPTVMAPLDGSPAAEAALPWAVHLARRANGALRLVGVHAPPAVMMDGETLVASVVPDESVRRKEADYFADVQARLKPAEVPVSAELLDGSVVSSLAEYARQLEPAWVVMLSHARGAVGRFFLGETAAEFVRSSPCPVLLVHAATGPVHPTAARDARQVLVPLDGSALAERMMGPATEFARLVGAEVTLLTAVGEVPNPAEARRYLEGQGERVREAGLTVEVRTPPGRPAADVIVAEAGARPGTVVALATHGRGGLSKLVWGSVTDDVVRRTPAPVLVFKPEEE